MKNTLKFALTAALLAAAPLASAEVADCVKISNSVKTAVAEDSSKVLEIVAKVIAANESCACEVVKAAIVASDADKKQVAKIVNVAILEAPSQIRLIAQCAIATAPDSVASVQRVLEKYDAAGGESYSTKGGLDSSKDAKGPVPEPDVESPNPLDYPFDSINDPIEKEFHDQRQFFFPPVEDDPSMTPMDDTTTGGGESISNGGELFTIETRSTGE